MKKLILFLMIFSGSIIIAQDKNDKWIDVLDLGNDKISLNTDGIDKFKGDDIFVWTLYQHKQPLVIETISNDIQKTKTYYLINKKLRRYSILQIIYYDSEDNVVKSFSYQRDSENSGYKYNYPILEESEMDEILKKALTYTE
ncbi:MAG: hypothetical protein K9J12_08045 [Melioribacteraceae bacterium]|nr:hypothetical protein [Melioribacteraceae bacterium]MCF8412933.1 hypothetical protein [Melioribacteraceae bacterium]